MIIRPSNQFAQADVDARANEDGRCHDQEVLHDEVDDVVWISLRAETPEYIPNHFAQATQGEWGE